MTFVKRNPGLSGKWEASGLAWLGEGTGAVAERASTLAVAKTVPVARVLNRTKGALELEKIISTAPTPAAAEEFGRRLVETHKLSAGAFGVGPDGWEGDGFQGPNSNLLALPLGQWATWGAFYAEAILEPLACVFWGGLASKDKKAITDLVTRLQLGDFDNITAPARLHGDLWSGNVMWRATADGGAEAVLIDPAAHGGHPETDLAALHLFGAPHLEHIIGAYAEAAQDTAHRASRGAGRDPARDVTSPVGGLDDEWRERIPLHQLHLLFLHVAIFGGGYLDSAMSAVRASLRL